MFFSSKFIRFIIHNKSPCILTRQMCLLKCNIPNQLQNNVFRRTQICLFSDISNVSSNNVQSKAIDSIFSQSDVQEAKIIKIDPDSLTNVNTNLAPIRQVWIENMFTPHSIKLGVMELHPDIFSSYPRPDSIQANHKWQVLYKHVDWTCLKTRAELKGSGRKPWPQKGLGKARHGSRKSPMWVGGGWAVGPRGPKTYFYMLPHHIRVTGLVATLSAKFSQNDIHVVDTFETFPIDGTQSHLEELCETRGWGPSVLFVDHVDLEQYPKCTNAEHLLEASKNVNHINILPVYGLNVFSMLKHETLVLTVDAIQQLQNRLLFNLRRIDLKRLSNYKPNPIYKM